MTARLVVDASVCVKWLTPEQDSDRAAAILSGSDDLFAPELVLAEVANALWSKVRRGELVPGVVGEMIQMLARDAPIVRIATEVLIGRALELAVLLDHPVYDTLYLATAEFVDGVVVTDDAPFRRAAGRSGFGALVRPLSE